MSCPPPTPDPCIQVCQPPPPAPPCRSKPIMRGLHWSQTQSVLLQAIVLAAAGGGMWYLFYVRPHMAAYKDYYAKAELEDQADEMARKGLFQSVPKGSLQDNKHVK